MGEVRQKSESTDFLIIIPQVDVQVGREKCPSAMIEKWKPLHPYRLDLLFLGCLGCLSFLSHFPISLLGLPSPSLLSNACLRVCLWGNPDQDTWLVYDGSKLRKENEEQRGWLPHKGETGHCRQTSPTPQASWSWPQFHLLPRKSNSNEQLLLLVLTHTGEYARV